MDAQSAANLLLKIPYLIREGPIPPLRVINDVLRRGEIDSGMSGAASWIPFQVAEAEYPAIVSTLRKIKPGLIEIEPPAEVNTREEWMSWRIVQKFSPGDKELTGLYDRRRAMTVELEAAESANQHERAFELKVQLNKIIADISKILKIKKSEQRADPPN